MTMVLSRPRSAEFDQEAIRADFPILQETVHGKKFVYLDSAASAQKPRQVIDAMCGAMERCYANIHRGVHWMSERATENYEAARDAVAELLNASTRDEIVFVRNSTEAINLVAHSYGQLLPVGSAVLISQMEHHSNIVPWQLLRERRGIELRVAPVTMDGELDLDATRALLADGKVSLVAITQMSNVLGTYVPVEELVAMAHQAGAKVLLDGSQAIVHRKIDVQAIGCDFYVFTGHKLYGPSGIGALWARRELLEEMPPFLGGGDMISSVTFEQSLWARVPHKFEAGTPAIIEGIGLEAAVRYVQGIGYEAISAHEKRLTDRLIAELDQIEGVSILGRARDRGGVVTFNIAGAHAHDVATLLDRSGIAIRAGQHCAEPLLRQFGVTSACRASFGIYNQDSDIDDLVTALRRVRSLLV